MQCERGFWWNMDLRVLLEMKKIIYTHVFHILSFKVEYLKSNVVNTRPKTKKKFKLMTKCSSK